MRNRVWGGLFLTILSWGLIAACSSAPQQTPAPPVSEAPPEERAPAPVISVPEEPLPEGIEGILTRIYRCLGRRDFTGALALFDEIEELDQEAAESSSVQILKASVLSSAGQRKESREVIGRVIAKEPGNVEALYLRSVLDGIEGREREQRAALEGIIKLDPVHVAALTELGNISLRNRSTKTAISYYDRALAADPNDGNALIGRARAYRTSQDPKNAETLLNKAITLYPQWSAPWSERARLYRGAGFFKDALADLDKAARLDPADFWISYDRGNVLLDLNRKRDALAEFKRAVSLDPDNFLSYVYTAGLKDDLGDHDGAAADYERLVQLRPEYYFAYEGLGLHMMRKQRWAEARDAFVYAYTKASDEASYALLAAYNWIKTGRSSDLKPFLEKALRKANRDSSDWTMLRLFYEMSGEMDLIQKIGQEQNPDTKAKMLFYLALYFDAKNNSVLANQYLQLMHEMGPRALLEWRFNEWIVAEQNRK